MGTDIHWYVEVQDDEGNWNFVGKEFINIDSIFNANWVGEEIKPPAYIYNWRSYYIFAQLAGVRREGYFDKNYYIPPRGIPDDCSNEYLMFVDWWGDDGHSHSWLLLKELYDIDTFPQLVLQAMEKLGSIDRVRALFFFNN